jgi:hypothetical protein
MAYSKDNDIDVFDIKGLEDRHDLGKNLKKRLREAFEKRKEAARYQLRPPFPPEPPVDNGDEEKYPNKIGNFTKGLRHDDFGEVIKEDYDALIRALNSGDPDDFENIPIVPGNRKLINPQAGLAFDLEGDDSHKLCIPPAPALDSAEEAGEIVENYWMALLRDVPFADYTNPNSPNYPLVQEAAADLSKLSNFKGPRENGKITPGTLFRGCSPGELVGPYISQFMWLNTPFGVEFVERRMRTRRAGLDYMTKCEDWLAAQNGVIPPEQREPQLEEQQFEPARRYIINGRDLGEWVHIDVLFQAYFNACLILQTPAKSKDPLSRGLEALINAGNPYANNKSKTQDGFGTFGPPYFITLVSEVATRALKAVWYQKWFVHRRLRPEAYAGLVHFFKIGKKPDYPIHPDVKNSSVLAKVFSHNEKLNQGMEGTYLLPMAFPEGSPIHPAYGAGHATVAGACVTILKALFDETFEIQSPVEPDPNDSTKLRKCDGPTLTVGGELNKLASNVALGRNIAGVHWRSDATASLKLGEELAISILRDQKLTFNENFKGYTFTKFDGTKATI